MKHAPCFPKDLALVNFDLSLLVTCYSDEVERNSRSDSILAVSHFESNLLKVAHKQDLQCDRQAEYLQQYVLSPGWESSFRSIASGYIYLYKLRPHLCQRDSSVVEQLNIHFTS